MELSDGVAIVVVPKSLFSPSSSSFSSFFTSSGLNGAAPASEPRESCTLASGNVPIALFPSTTRVLSSVASSLTASCSGGFGDRTSGAGRSMRGSIDMGATAADAVVAAMVARENEKLKKNERDPPV